VKQRSTDASPSPCPSPSGRGDANSTGAAELLSHGERLGEGLQRLFSLQRFEPAHRLGCAVDGVKGGLSDAGS